MLNSTELRKGIVIELNDKLYQVVEYKHIKMKRTALVRLKLRRATQQTSARRLRY